MIGNVVLFAQLWWRALHEPSLSASAIGLITVLLLLNILALLDELFAREP